METQMHEMRSHIQAMNMALRKVKPATVSLQGTVRYLLKDTESSLAQVSKN